jgi:hypothetical protein
MAPTVQVGTILIGFFGSIGATRVQNDLRRNYCEGELPSGFLECATPLFPLTPATSSRVVISMERRYGGRPNWKHDLYLAVVVTVMFLAGYVVGGVNHTDGLASASDGNSQCQAPLP